MAAARWLNELGVAQDEARSVMRMLNERDNLRRSGGRGAGELATKARSGLNRLERLVEDLETDLGDADMGLSRKELQRRRRLLNTLSREVADLRKAEGRKVQTAERESLMRPGGGSSRGGRGAGYGSGGSDDDPHAGMTNRDMLQAQRDGMAKQDEILDEMAIGIGNLAQIGRNIGDEASYHTRLLGEIEEDVDRGQRGLKKETKHAKKVEHEAKVGWMYGVICLLIVVLIVLLVMAKKK